MQFQCTVVREDRSYRVRLYSSIWCIQAAEDNQAFVPPEDVNETHIVEEYMAFHKRLFTNDLVVCFAHPENLGMRIGSFSVVPKSILQVKFHCSAFFQNLRDIPMVLPLKAQSSKKMAQSSQNWQRQVPSFDSGGWDGDGLHLVFVRPFPAALQEARPRINFFGQRGLYCNGRI